MKITEKKLRTLIREALLLEYEQYVDDDGNVYDDEGNVTRRGKAFGRRYGGGTYGLRGLPPGGRSGSSRRKTGYVGAAANKEKIEVLQAVLQVKPSNFLDSIIKQLYRGRSLSQKQLAIVKKMVKRHAPESLSVFG